MGRGASVPHVNRTLSAGPPRFVPGYQKEGRRTVWWGGPQGCGEDAGWSSEPFRRTHFMQVLGQCRRR
jgi:hypothetical protein